MSDVQLYLFNFDKDRDEASKYSKETAESMFEISMRSWTAWVLMNHHAELAKKEIRLTALIESLGEYLNNEDASIRAKSNLTRPPQPESSNNC